MKGNSTTYYVIILGLTLLTIVPRVLHASALQSIENIAAAADEDRKQKYEQSRDKARQTNQQQLQPNMMEHLGKAQKHMKDAEEAREKKEFGKAQEDEKKAMMEQMKAQQLQQQMKENENSAQQNDAGSKKLINDSEETPQTAKAEKNPVISIRDPGYSSNAPPAAAPAPPPEVKPPIPKEELANLASATFVPTTLSPRAAVQKAPEDKGVGANTMERYGYDEGGANGKGFSKTTPAPVTPSASAPTSAGAAPAGATASTGFGAGVTSGSGSGSGSGGGGGGAGGGGGDFWKSAGGMVEAENQQLEAKEMRLSLANLRGSGKKSGQKEDKMPGSDLSDDAFWKKVGKMPAKCKAVSELSKGQRQKCLRTARKEMERKWRGSQRKLASDEPELKTKTTAVSTLEK